MTLQKDIQKMLAGTGLKVVRIVAKRFIATSDLAEDLYSLSEDEKIEKINTSKEKDSEGNTVLHILARDDSESVQEAVFNAGKLGIANNKGVTPLHILAESDFDSILAKVTGHAGFRKLEDADGETPEDYSQGVEKHLEEMVEKKERVNEERKGDPNQKREGRDRGTDKIARALHRKLTEDIEKIVKELKADGSLPTEFTLPTFKNLEKEVYDNLRELFGRLFPNQLS